MKRNGRTTAAAAGILAAALWLVAGCNEPKTAANEASEPSRSAPARSIEAGTHIQVALGSGLSSETASVGDGWHGTVTERVTASNGGSIPAGSEVSGAVEAVTAAKRGSRAMLELGIRSIRVNGHDESITASAEPVIAGSTRKRNVGAVAGGALAGALLGKVVGDGKNAAVGGLVGGAATAGVVATSKGFQVVLSSGTVMNFTVRQTVAMR
jgi:hypothetical protein